MFYTIAVEHVVQGGAYGACCTSFQSFEKFGAL